MRKVTATVISNELICSDMRPDYGEASSHIIWLKCPEIASDAKPGQFVMIRCGSEFILRRPLSIHRVRNDSLALFFIAWKAQGTWWLSQRKTQDNIDLFGPLGNSFNIQPDLEQILLAAGGMGMAPIMYLADTALEQEKKVTLLEGVRYTSQLFPRELLPKQINLITITEDGKFGNQGRISDILPKFSYQADEVFACGPTAMYREMAQMRQLKDKPVQISLEARMGCGRGVCYGCTVRTKRGLKQVCQDGPVFELNDIIWDELSPKL